MRGNCFIQPWNSEKKIKGTTDIYTYRLPTGSRSIHIKDMHNFTLQNKAGKEIYRVVKGNVELAGPKPKLSKGAAAKK